jgi:hypothetical protein
LTSLFVSWLLGDVKTRKADYEVGLSSNIVYHTKRLEPANIAEVLTVRQVCMLGIHTVCYLEGTSVVHVVYALEGVYVVLLLHELKSIDAIDVLLALLVGLDGNNLYAYSVVKALLVEHYGELHIGTAGYVEVSDVGSRYYLDSIPTLSYGLLPCSNLLSLGIVIG